MSLRIDLSGNSYGKLQVVRYYGKDNRGRSLWWCRCECGKQKEIRGDHLSRGLTRSCGCLCERKGSDSPAWRGGTQESHGYVMIYNPQHLKATPKGYVYEHILVLEKKLGRPLLPDEVTHHLDGNTKNNHPDNLEVTSRSEHGRMHHSGELNQQAKLTATEVLEIKRMKGITRRNMAAQYGVTKACIDDILGGRSWRSVTESHNDPS